MRISHLNSASLTFFQASCFIGLYLCTALFYPTNPNNDYRYTKRENEPIHHEPCDTIFEKNSQQKGTSQEISVFLQI